MQYISSEALIASPKFELYTPGFKAYARSGDNSTRPISDRIIAECLKDLWRFRKLLTPSRSTHPVFISDLKSLTHHFCPNIPCPESEEDLQVGLNWYNLYFKKNLTLFSYSQGLYQYLLRRCCRSIYTRKESQVLRLALTLDSIFKPLTKHRPTNEIHPFREQVIVEYLNTRPIELLRKWRNSPEALDASTRKQLAEGFQAVLDAPIDW